MRLDEYEIFVNLLTEEGHPSKKLIQDIGPLLNSTECENIVNLIERIMRKKNLEKI